MPRTSDPDVGGSSPTQVIPCCVIEQGEFTPQKVLVLPRKRDVKNQSTNQPSRVMSIFTNELDKMVLGDASSPFRIPAARQY